MNSPQDDKAIEDAGPATVDSLRGGLCNNPCILLENDEGPLFLSDPCLARAFLNALKVHKKEKGIETI